MADHDARTKLRALIALATDERAPPKEAASAAKQACRRMLPLLDRLEELEAKQESVMNPGLQQAIEDLLGGVRTDPFRTDPFRKAPPQPEVHPYVHKKPEKPEFHELIISGGTNARCARCKARIAAGYRAIWSAGHFWHPACWRG